MPTLTTTRLTAEQFAEQFADADFCELERGEVIHLMAGGWQHSSISSRVAWLLTDWARRTNAGRVLTNEAGLITARNPDTVRGVDVLYYSFERVPKGREPESFADVPPNLAVEIVGKGQSWQKMTEKAGEYLAIGADRAWIIDPRRQTLHVFRPDEPPQAFGLADTLTDEAVLPGFTCRIAEIFER